MDNNRVYLYVLVQINCNEFLNKMKENLRGKNVQSMWIFFKFFVCGFLAVQQQMQKTNESSKATTQNFQGGVRFSISICNFLLKKRKIPMKTIFSRAIRNNQHFHRQTMQLLYRNTISLHPLPIPIDFICLNFLLDKNKQKI